MTFERAVAYLRAGRKIRRLGQGEAYFERNSSHIVPLDWTLESDWEVVPTPKVNTVEVSNDLENWTLVTGTVDLSCFRYVRQTVER